MAISKAYVPDVSGGLRAEFRVDGDNPWTSHPTEGAAEKREADLAAEKPKTG